MDVYIHFVREAYVKQREMSTNIVALIICLSFFYQPSLGLRTTKSLTNAQLNFQSWAPVVELSQVIQHIILCINMDKRRHRLS